MKFCQKRTLLYRGLSGILTSTDYVVLEDVQTFHGQNFADKWQDFIFKKPTFIKEGITCFYYPDYEFAARQTDSFLNPIG